MLAKILIIISTHRRSLLALFGVVLVLNLLPLGIIFVRCHLSWGDLFLALNSYGNGAVYYDARIKEIKDGFPLLGNPFFLEHNQKIAPAFLAADWLQAVPLMSGASFEFTVAFGFLFWSLVFVFLAYAILIQIALPRGVSLAGAVLSYISVYSLMLGPVSMQIVFPFLLLFFLALVLWLKDPNSKPKAAFLILTSAVSFYIYTYLWQAVLAILFLTLLFFLVVKKKRVVINLSVVIFLSFVLAIPLIIFTLKQIAQPYYWETMIRTGFIHTHWPAAEAYYSGRWVALMLILWLLLWRWAKEYRDDKNYRLSFIFFAVTGIGFELVSLSNVITGQELELAGHMVRFITVWLALAITVYLFLAWKNIQYLKSIGALKKTILIVSLGICLLGVWQYAQSYFLIVGNMTKKGLAAEIPDYRRPLEWLERNISQPVVVWANYREGINAYIPILTKHYILFDSDGVLHFLSDEEAEERYLVAGYMNDINQSDIEKEYEIYAGIGNAIHPYKVYNRQIKLCRLLGLKMLGVDCGELTDPISFKGKEYFSNLFQKYNNEIKPAISQELRKFHVAYIIKDKKSSSGFDPASLTGSRLVYSDQRFLIYKID